LVDSRNAQGGCLRDLLQVVVGHSACEGNQPSLERDLDIAQRHISGRVQGVLDAPGQVKILSALDLK